MAEEQVGTLDETIASTYKEILARDDDGGKLNEEDPSPLDEGTPEKPEGTPTEEVEAKGPARDEQGRFARHEEKPEASKVDAKAPPEKAAPPAEAVAAAVEVPTRADGKPVDLNRPPAEWKPAAKAEWSKIPEPVRAEILRREVDAYKKFSESAPDAEMGRNIRSLGERYHQVIALDGGGDIRRAVGAFFHTASVLRFGTPAQKRQAIDYLEQNYGVPAKQAPQVDANVQPVQQPQQEFRDPRVDQLMASMQQEESRRRAESDRVANDATTKFLSATNDKGEPLYPFVTNVLEDMTARVPMIRARNPGITHDEALKQAYEAATWANPETRAILQQQEQQRLEAQRRGANLQKVGSARQAAAVNVAQKGAPPAQAPVGTIDDTVRDTYREIMSRA